jgi:hypothetical protein
MKHSEVILGGVLAAGMWLSASTQAQIVASHYPAGAEGIKAASLPPTGLYLRDYNFFYTADRFKDGPPDFSITGYINAPRLIWMTDKKILGATYGMDVIVPFGYLDWEIKGLAKDHHFGIGDVEFEPLLLSWHLDRFDFSAAYAVWAPTGDFRPDRPDLLAKGFWSHMLTLGGTWYADSEKTWAVSILNRYEFAHQQRDTEIDPGQVLTVEWGLSKTVSKGIDVGCIGYYQQQTTHDDGLGASPLLDRVVGVGPEVSAFWPKLGLFTSLRCAFEFAARERPEGQRVTLTITKPL